MNICSFKSIVPLVVDSDVNCTAFRNAFGANGQDAVVCPLSCFRHIAMRHKGVIVACTKLSVPKFMIPIFWRIVAENTLSAVPIIRRERHVFQ